MNQENFFLNLDQLHLSASAFKLLLESPKQYYEDYVLGNKEVKKGKHFDEGSLVHCMVLEAHNVNEKFVNMGVPVPSDNTKACIDRLLSLETESDDLDQYHDEILDYLREVNLHQSLVDDKKSPFVTGDSKRLGKIITDSSKEYFRLMVISRTKVIVDENSWSRCQDKADAIIANPLAFRLLRETDEGDQLRYELELKSRHENFKYGLKGILDVIKVSKKDKTIYISDVKTTAALLKDFTKSVDAYDYWLQGAIYKLLALAMLGGKIYDYKIVFHFIVVDRNNDVYCFNVSEATMELWMIQLEELINTKINYHIENKDFTLPYEFANNLISL